MNFLIDIQPCSDRNMYAVFRATVDLCVTSSYAPPANHSDEEKNAFYAEAKNLENA